ncbi:GDP-L-fucose synthase family protein [Calditrichota bacterium]
MDKHDLLFLAGHRGLVGSGIHRALQERGYSNILTATRSELDLTEQHAVNAWFGEHKPATVILAAAKVGGILANNNYPAEFIRDNLLIQTNVLESARKHDCQKFIFLGSSCIYPKFAPQPLREDYLLTDTLEPTNEPYAIAKIAGIKMCQAYYRQYGFKSLCLMPTNLYGPGDNFDLQNSHVIPGLINKFHIAIEERHEKVTIWGTGKPLREFLHVSDMAAACLHLLKMAYTEFITTAPDLMMNIGTGTDVSIADLSRLLKDISGFEGALVFDDSKPDGTPRKLMDVSRLLSCGWSAQLSLEEGLKQTWNWFREQQSQNLRK